MVNYADFLWEYGQRVELMLAHEQQHEDDFFEEIWEGGGYDAQKDNEGDTLRDDWEATQVMDGSNEWGQWVFDVPGGADGTDQDKDSEVWVETIDHDQEGLIISGSDERADDAAKAAVDADRKINKKDWSDLDVDAERRQFGDEDGGAEEKTNLLQGNNKDYHPEEE